MHPKSQLERKSKERWSLQDMSKSWVMQHSTSYHTLRNIIQQLLRGAIYPFLCECTDEGVLVCPEDSFDPQHPLPPKASHISMGFRSGERAGHTRR
ncbi:hypothetical protein TNCV_562351 [Trichonephila clavipes]|nr:hypothetical protein TNCV_562351 [Trichonephila clavipes]